MPNDLSDYQPTPDVGGASTIPSRWYVDPAFLAAEQESIFARTWHEYLSRSGPVGAP